MEPLLQKSGLPADALNVIRTLLSRAGYDVDDEADLVIGIAAATATFRVCEAIQTRTEVRREQPGRNAPCPCGSGKKYKKCCLKADRAGVEPKRYDPGNPLARSDLIPRIYAADTLAQELSALEELFETDPTLREIRFTPAKVLTFLQACAQGEKPLPPPEDPEALEIEQDRRVARFLREVEGFEALGNLDQALLQAARDSARCDADVRALAVGLALAEMEIATDSPGDDVPSPLIHMLFRLTLKEIIDGVSEITEEVRELYSESGCTVADVAENPARVADLARLIADRGGVALETLRPAGEATYRELIEHIVDGRFPVALPVPSILPTLVPLSNLDLDVAPIDEVKAILAAGVAALGKEDAEVMDQILEKWLDDNHDTASQEDLTAAAQVRMATAAGAFNIFRPALIHDAIFNQRNSSLPDEPQLPPKSETEGSFTTEFLEAYGDFLLAHELPLMAARTWLLAENLGPLPTRLETKLAALEQTLAATPQS